MIRPNGATVVVADGETLRLFKSGGHDAARSLTALPAPELDGGDTGASHRSSAAQPDDKTQTEDGYAAVTAA